MHAEINARFDVWIDEDKDLTLAALAESVTQQNLESTILDVSVNDSWEEIAAAK